MRSGPTSAHGLTTRLFSAASRCSSRSRVRPTSAARSRPSIRSPVCIHNHVSSTVSASGRVRSPAAAAREELTCHTPREARHSGIFDHCLTPSDRRTSSPIQNKAASLPVTRMHSVSKPPNVAEPTGAVTLKSPVTSSRAQSSANTARSRTSIGWIVRSGDPGAITCPPRLSRLSHQRSRPTYSRGPSTTPGRRIVVRSGLSASRTAASQPAF